MPISFSTRPGRSTRRSMQAGSRPTSPRSGGGAPPQPWACRGRAGCSENARRDHRTPGRRLGRAGRIPGRDLRAASLRLFRVGPRAGRSAPRRGRGRIAPDRIAAAGSRSNGSPDARARARRRLRRRPRATRPHRRRRASRAPRGPLENGHDAAATSVRGGRVDRAWLCAGRSRGVVGLLSDQGPERRGGFGVGVGRRGVLHWRPARAVAFIPDGRGALFDRRRGTRGGGVPMDACRAAAARNGGACFARRGVGADGRLRRTRDPQPPGGDSRHGRAVPGARCLPPHWARSRCARRHPRRSRTIATADAGSLGSLVGPAARTEQSRGGRVARRCGAGHRARASADSDPRRRSRSSAVGGRPCPPAAGFHQSPDQCSPGAAGRDSRGGGAILERRPVGGRTRSGPRRRGRHPRAALRALRHQQGARNGSRAGALAPDCGAPRRHVAAARGGALRCGVRGVVTHRREQWLMAQVLVVDDEAKLGRIVCEALEIDGHEVIRAGGGREVLVTDLRMPEVDGLAILRAARAQESAPEVVVMTAFGSTDSAVEAMKAGAADYLTKPFSLDELRMRVRRLCEQRTTESKNARLVQQLIPELVAESAQMKAVLAAARQVAQSDATVLLLGESGTGKSQLARFIHFAGRRAAGPVLEVHCAALSETLLESELFGHERGAFTGAHERRQGLLAAAEGGTLFLDEVGEITAPVQVKLLRFLQDRQFVPVGSTQSRKVDVRVVAATNRDLVGAVKDGSFREDFYYRLNVFGIEVPPLRERREEILPLAGRLLRARRVPAAKLDGSARERLLANRWPGNVRELENALERALILAGEGPVGGEHLPEGNVGAAAARARGVPADLLADGFNLDVFERDLIHAALIRAGGNKTAAARMLGITRRRLYSRLQSLQER